MALRLVRPDPHNLAKRKLVCDGCGYSEAPPIDIEAHSEDRPRLPGF